MSLSITVGMICLTPLRFGEQLAFRALPFRQSRLRGCGEINIPNSEVLIYLDQKIMSQFLTSNWSKKCLKLCG